MISTWLFTPTFFFSKHWNLKQKPNAYPHNCYSVKLSNLHSLLCGLGITIVQFLEHWRKLLSINQKSMVNYLYQCLNYYLTKAYTGAEFRFFHSQNLSNIYFRCETLLVNKVGPQNTLLKDRQRWLVSEYSLFAVFILLW